MAKQPVVLIPEPIAEAGVRLLEPSCEIINPGLQGRTFTEEELKAADALIVRLTPVTESLLAAASNLKVIGRHGTGLDSVDLRAASARGIPVVYTPGVNANAVAEHAVSMMLALARQTVAADQAVRQNRFKHRDSLMGFEVRGKTLGIVGMGSVGTRVAEICQRGFEMKILAFDPYLTKRPVQPGIVFVDSLRELLEQSEIITLHLPLTPETHHLINAATLSYMKRSALLINTARGGIVEAQALTEALHLNQIRGAGLDVFENEPLPPDHPLLSSPRTVLSPHIAGATRESMEEMARQVARQVLMVLRGVTPEFLANPEALKAKVKVEKD